ncbi:unnamed protein product [Urochloa humidicola]
MGDTHTRPAAGALEAVLRRVPPRSLAACRCVCRKWRAIVDSRRLLRPDLLPLSVGGIFLSLGRAPQAPPALFARPSSSPAARRILAGRQLESYVETITTETDDTPIMTILDCCNGLVLLADELVVNPATRQCARVPPCPAWPDGYCLGDAYLAYDPLVSPNDFEVILIQDPSFYEDKLEDGSEWPPSCYTMSIYSSRTRAWEERPFVRDSDPAGTFAEARSAREPETRHAVYWHGALYVHCKGDFILRIELSDHKYRVIKLPEGVSSTTYFYLHLAKSKDGVYFALARSGFKLQVWLLNEVDGKAEWLSKYDINLRAVDAHFKANRDYPVEKPWILRDGYYKKGNSNRGPEVVEEWDSDDDNVLEIEADGRGSEEKGHSSGIVSILGFHPFKEVAFLQLSLGRVVACHLDTSKIQDLGNLSLGYYGDVVDTTFVYTPCWIGELAKHN